MPDLRMTVGYRLPGFSATLRDPQRDTDPDGALIDLTDTECFLVVKALDGGTAFGEESFEHKCLIANPLAGSVVLDWQQEWVDAARPGVLQGYVRVVDTATGLVVYRVPEARTFHIIMSPGV